MKGVTAMLDNRFLGRSALVLLSLAIAVMLLLVFQPVLRILNPEAALFVAGILTLLAAVIGFCAFRTSEGKVAAIAGLVLLILFALFISFITPVSEVETGGGGAEEARPLPPPARP